MLNRAQQIIHNLINGWTLLFLTILMFFSGSFVSSLGYRFNAHATGPIRNNDWSYTSQDIPYAISMYQHVYNNNGLQFYADHQMMVDLIYPIASAVFCFFFIAYILYKLVKIKHLIPVALILPTAIMIVQYIELAGVVWMLKSDNLAITRAAQFIYLLIRINQILQTLEFWFIVLGLLALYIVFIVGILKKPAATT